LNKIAIINSPVHEHKDKKNKEDYLPPLGLGIIATNLEKHNKIIFIDPFKDDLSLQELIENIVKEKYEFVCINIFTTNYKVVRKIVESLKINIHWIIGGIATRALYSMIFKWDTHNPIDIVYGDGELIVKDIIKDQIKIEPFSSSDNRRYFIVDTKSEYFVKDISGEKLNRNYFKNESEINFFGEEEVAIYTSRGCPYNCSFCVAASSLNREINQVRRKSPLSVIEEIKDLQNKHPKLKSVRILDDLFLYTKDSFQDAIKIFKIFNLSWRSMCHIQSIVKVDVDILKKIRNSGCRELFIGIESGSPEILEKINKKNDISTILESLEKVFSSGIDVKGYFILGFPDESEIQMRETINLAQKIKDLAMKYKTKFRTSVFQYRPYLGTLLCDEIIRVRKISPEQILEDTKESNEINKSVRNKSFNFDSGNYSCVSDELLMRLIKEMENLNG